MPSSSQTAATPSWYPSTWQPNNGVQAVASTKSSRKPIVKKTFSDNNVITKAKSHTLQPSWYPSAWIPGVSPASSSENLQTKCHEPELIQAVSVKEGEKQSSEKSSQKVAGDFFAQAEIKGACTPPSPSQPVENSEAMAVSAKPVSTPLQRCKPLLSRTYCNRSINKDGATSPNGKLSPRPPRPAKKMRPSRPSRPNLSGRAIIHGSSRAPPVPVSCKPSKSC